MATLIPIAVNPSGPGFVQATSADTISIPGGIALPTFTQGSVIFAGASGALTQDNANLFFDDTNNSLGIGTAAPGTVTLAVVQPVKTTGSPNALRVTGGAHTTLAIAEASDVYFNFNRTVQFSNAGGTLALQRAFSLAAPTYSAAAAMTITDAATLGISGAPVKSTNATLTRTSALYIGAGAVSTATAGYGIYCNAPTGATNNYCAAFMGGYVGINNNAPDADLAITQAVATTGNPTVLKVVGGAHTGLSISEKLDVVFSLSRIVTFGAAGGVIASQRAFAITSPTYSTAAAMTITDASLLNLWGAPIKGTGGVTMTRTHALLIDTRDVSTAVASYGLTVNAMTGATNNYAAAFLGGATGFGTNAPTAYVHVTQPVVTSGSPTALQVVGGTHTTLAAAMASDIVFDLGRQVQFSTGAHTQAAIRVTPPLYSAVGASVFSYITTLELTCATAFTNVTATEVSSLLIAANSAYFGSGAATNAYGMVVNAPSGDLSNRYAARFNGTGHAGTSNSSVVMIADGYLGASASVNGCGNLLKLYTVGRLTQTASTEASAVYIDVDQNRQWSTGPLTWQRDVYITNGLYSFVGASTISDTATLYIGGPPVAGTNATITRSYGIYVEGTGVNAGTTTSYGLRVLAPTGGTNMYAAAFTGGATGFGTATPTAYVHEVQPVVTSGSPNALLVAGGAHTTLAAATEASDVYFNLARTVQFTTGADLTMQRAVLITAPTYGMTAATGTITEAATLAISGGPVEGTNTDLKSSYGILVQSGAVGAADNSYGIKVIAQTGATNNYAAYFTGGHSGFGTVSTSAYVNITQHNETSGSPNALRVVSGKHTTLAAATEASHVVFDFTQDVEFTAGAAITLLRAIAVTAPTYKATGATSITTAATLGITSAPIATAGATTIDKSCGILVQSTDVTGSGVGVVTESYGIQAYASTGGTRNASARFTGASGGTAVTPTYVMVVEQEAVAGGCVGGIIFLGAAKTNQATTAEVTSLNIQPSTREWATGAIGFQKEVKILCATYSFVGASVITDAASFYVEGPPVADANATITNDHGIYIGTKDVTPATGIVTYAYGLTVNAPTGAGTGNYAAQFMGGNVGIGTATPAYLETLYIGGTSPTIALALTSATCAGPGNTLQDSHVLVLQAQSYENAVSAHYGTIFIDAMAQTYAGQPAFRVRDGIDTFTLASAYELLTCTRPASTSVVLRLNDEDREGDNCYITPTAKTGAAKNGDDLYVSGGDSIGADHVPGSLYLDCGALGTGSTTIQSVYVGTLYTGEVVNICKSDGLLGFFGTTAIVRNDANPFTLNGGATSYNLPNGTATALDLEKCLRQLLLVLGETAGYGLINVTA